MRRENKISVYLMMGILLIVLDQLTKLWVKGFSFAGFEHEGLHFGQMISVIGSFVQFTYVENAGMAFGIEFGAGKIFLSLFSIIAGVVLVYLLVKLRNANPWIKIGVMMIFAGAVGNLIDRVFYGVIFGESSLFYGRVVDFIQVDIPDIHFLGLNYTYWPVFNVADACVSVGVIILILFNKQIPHLRELVGKGAIKKTEETETKPLENV